MATRSTVPDPAVDELRRRARRRLVGAIVLAMAAAVVLPILLESDPKPLGDEVSVRIPPIDSGKFVNPLSPAPGPATKSSTKAPVSAAPVLPTPPPTPAPAPAVPGKGDAPAAPGDGTNTNSDVTKSDTKPAPQARNESVATPDASTKDSPAPTDSPPAKVEAPVKTEPRSEARPEAPVKSDVSAKSTEPPHAAAAKADAGARAAGGAFAVQVGAYADAKAATDLVGTLKGQGFSGYGETVPTTHGPVRRVRVGPFANRAEADAAVARLKAAGYERAIVVGK
jgi:DedD protein